MRDQHDDDDEDTSNIEGIDSDSGFLFGFTRHPLLCHSKSDGLHISKSTEMPSLVSAATFFFLNTNEAVPSLHAVRHHQAL
jgi:hypothetical protein